MPVDHYSADDEPEQSVRKRKPEMGRPTTLEGMVPGKKENPAVTRIRAAAGEVFHLLEQKNASYGDNNLRKFGRFGILVRVSDKIERLKNLLENKVSTTLTETEKDTWMDIAGYAIQAVRFINEEQGNHAQEGAEDHAR